MKLWFKSMCNINSQVWCFLSLRSHTVRSFSPGQCVMHNCTFSSQMRRFWHRFSLTWRSFDPILIQIKWPALLFPTQETTLADWTTCCHSFHSDDKVLDCALLLLSSRLTCFEYPRRRFKIIIDLYSTCSWWNMCVVLFSPSSVWQVYESGLYHLRAVKLKCMSRMPWMQTAIFFFNWSHSGYE